MPEKNEFETPSLNAFISGNWTASCSRNAKEELEALKLLAAKKLIDNYCEYYGVPKEVVGATDEQLIEWATQQHQKELDELRVTWP